MKRYLLIALAFFCISTSTALANCRLIVPINEFTDYINQKINHGDFSCAISLVKDLRISSFNSPEESGINDRFVLRNLALEINSIDSFPIKSRFDLVNAAVFEPQYTSNQKRYSDSKYDEFLLYKVGTQYFNQQNTEYWLKSLILAITIDQQQSDENRVIDSLLFNELTTKSNEAYSYLPQIIELAKLIRSDKSLSGYRNNIYTSTEYYIPVWSSDRPREDVLLRASQASQLAKLLDGCSLCYKGWQYNRLIAVASAYYKLGMKKEADEKIKEAIHYAELIESPDARLRAEDKILHQLYHDAPHSFVIIKPLLDKMEVLANSLKSKEAREIYEKLPMMYFLKK